MDKAEALKLTKIDNVEVSDLSKSKEYLIYIGNLKNIVNAPEDKTYAPKYLFLVDRYEDAGYKVRVDLKNMHTGEIWTRKYDNARKNSDFILASKLVSKFGILNAIASVTEPMQKILEKKYYNTAKISAMKNANKVDIESLMPGVTVSGVHHTSDKNEIKQSENKTMNDKVNEVMNANSEAAKIAAKVTAGNALNTAVLAKISPNMPMLLRGYSEHPLAPVVAANIVSFAVSSFAADNEKAVWVADAMMVAAMGKVFEAFNIEQMLKELMETANITDIPTS